MVAKPINILVENGDIQEGEPVMVVRIIGADGSYHFGPAGVLVIPDTIYLKRNFAGKTSLSRVGVTKVKVEPTSPATFLPVGKSEANDVLMLIYNQRSWFAALQT